MNVYLIDCTDGEKQHDFYIRGFSVLDATTKAMKIIGSLKFEPTHVDIQYVLNIKNIIN